LDFGVVRAAFDPSRTSRHDTLGGAFAIDAFKLVKRGSTVVSLSGSPDRDFVRREGKGLVVRIAV
jgi:alcohol dehydrogenase